MSGALIQCQGHTVVLLDLHFDGAVLSLALFKWPQRVSQTVLPGFMLFFVFPPQPLWKMNVLPWQTPQWCLSLDSSGYQEGSHPLSLLSPSQFTLPSPGTLSPSRSPGLLSVQTSKGCVRSQELHHDGGQDQSLEGSNGFSSLQT